MPMVCLIVDDSATVRKITRLMMEGLGFQCAEAADGQEACNFCENRMPDLIILDWNMPVMTGIEFMPKLRAMENGDFPKVLFCTTENGMSFIEKAVGAGADEYIMKPFDKSILESKLIQIGLIAEEAAE